MSSEVGKAERASRICTASGEKEKRRVNKSPSSKINAEDDLKSTILNLFKQIQELQQEQSSASFQDQRFYSKSDPLIFEMTYGSITAATCKAQNA